MILKNPFTKKTLLTLLSVCFVVTVSASNGDGNFFVKEGTIIAGLNKVNIPSSPKVNQNLIYVKEKTVFYVDKNTPLNVIYIPDTKTVTTGKKVITSFKKPIAQVQVQKAIQAKRQQTKQAQLQVTPIHNNPFSKDYYNFYGKNLAIVIPIVTQRTSSNTTFKDKASHTICYALSTLKNTARSTKNVTNNFSHKTSKYNLHILKTNFGRPPPVV